MHRPCRVCQHANFPTRSFSCSFTQKNIESVLRKYIRDYVTCHTCKSPTTILAKHSRLYFLQYEVRAREPGLCCVAVSTASLSPLLCGFVH